MDIATVAALPNHLIVLGEDLSSFNVFHKSKVALFVTFLSNSNATIHLSYFWKTFSISHLSKMRISLCPLLVLSCNSCLKIVYGTAYNTCWERSGNLYIATF